MLHYHLKVGLLPLRRYRKETFIGIFQAEYALENKQKCLPYIREHFADADTEFVDLDWLNEEGILRLNADCEKVVEYFREQKIDALFIIACNFGNEEAAGEVAKQLRVPTLLWGPRDRNYSEDPQRRVGRSLKFFTMQATERKVFMPSEKAGASTSQFSI